MSTTNTHGRVDPSAPRIASRRARSASTPGLTYLVEVNLDTGFGSCECPGYAFRGRCRHVDEARQDAGVEAPAPA
ncbi:MAG: hypothetical protein OXK17_06465 [Thaumarchaeota archaeon]|nr:hypothetical protein [Nitrososphaerota archaeon]